MLRVSKWMLILAGALLVGDAIAMAAGIPNPLFGWPLPCPATLILLGTGIALFCLGSGAFKKMDRS